jgi:hypothetical protein
MSKQVSYKQDLPPKGGYKAIEFRRLPTWSPKRKNSHAHTQTPKYQDFYKSLFLLLASYFAVAIGLFLPFASWHYVRNRKIAM